MSAVNLDESVKDSVLKYMKEHNCMTIATAGAGTPWAAAVFYVNDGFKLYFLSDPDSRHSVNIEANSSVAATINEDYSDWHRIQGIQLEGKAQKVASALEKAKAMSLYIAKYPFVADFFSPTSKIFKKVASKIASVKFYKIEPSIIWFTDNAREFGFRGCLVLKERTKK